MKKRLRSHSSRNGTVLITALVCLLVVMTILGGMLQGTLRARRQLRVDRDLRQTELLLQAGTDRAAAQLFRDADYRGETWNLSAKSIVGSGEGQVTIEASPDTNKRSWQVRVVAEYPLGGDTSIRRSHTFLVQSQFPPAKE